MQAGGFQHLRALDGETATYETFTGRFPGSDADEGAWAEIVSGAARTTTHETFPTGEKLVSNLDDFLWMNELPVDSTSQFAQWCVFEAAKEAGVTVLLDGQGGDEILAGYEQYFAPYLATRRRDGTYIRFEDNAAVLINPQGVPMPVARPIPMRNGVSFWPSPSPSPLRSLFN